MAKRRTTKANTMGVCPDGTIVATTIGKPGEPEVALAAFMISTKTAPH